MATRDTYEMQAWENLPSKETPVTAECLEHIEQGIKDAADKRALKEIYDDTAINFGRKSGATAGMFSAAFGQENYASGYCSQSGGKYNTSSGARSSTAGYGNTAGGDDSHVEGHENKILGSYGHGEGYGNKDSSSSYAIHMEGGSNSAEGRSSYSHLEGEGNKTTGGSYIHLEGTYNEMLNSSARSVHMEGSSNKSSGSDSHNEGGYNVLVGNYSHLEGYDNTELENSSLNHIEGNYNKAGGQYNHVEGNGNTAGGYGIHVSGLNNKGTGQYQAVYGKYNAENGNAAFIVGGGTSDSERKNIYMLDWQGNAFFAGDVHITYNGRNLSLYGIQMEMESRFNFLVNGIMPAKVFDTKADLDTWLAEEGNADTLKIGQNIYIKETDTPDYWWDGTGLQILETDKIAIESLSYDETMAILNATAEEVA